MATRGASWASAGVTAAPARTIPNSAQRARMLTMSRSAPGFLGLFHSLRLVRLVGLGLVRLRCQLRMPALVAADDVAEALVGQQPLRLHRLEDPAPAAIALLPGRDLVERQRGRGSALLLRL